MKFSIRPTTEAVAQPLYDSLPVSSGPFLRFFDTPIGVGGKRFSRTNLFLSRQIPSPQHFLCRGIHVDVTGSDIFRRKVAGNGYLELIVGSKTFLTLGPLGVFMPTRLRFKGRRIVPRRFKLDEAYEISPIMFNSHEPFYVNVDMDFPAPRSKEMMYVHLDGFIYRPEQ